MGETGAEQEYAPKQFGEEDISAWEAQQPSGAEKSTYEEQSNLIFRGSNLMRKYNHYLAGEEQEANAHFKAKSEYEDRLYAAMMEKEDIEDREPSVGVPPKPPEYNPFLGSNARVFSLAASALLVISATGPMFAKMGSTAAMNSLSAALNGLHQGNEDRYNAEMKNYHEQIRIMEKKYQFELNHLTRLANQKNKDMEQIYREMGLHIKAIDAARTRERLSYKDVNHTLEVMQKHLNALQTRTVKSSSRGPNAQELFLLALRQENARRAKEGRTPEEKKPLTILQFRPMYNARSKGGPSLKSGGTGTTATKMSDADILAGLAEIEKRLSK